ncbi:MAG TPA: hypothetical protein VHX38_13630 [Pseudonocardiaceae bacterium]|jgi:hypothetical protein|nr:hypothetical protein [Pseudonocardiaceae bacterium]
MRKGSLPRSIVLPAGQIDVNHAPDGLRESDIDALLAELCAEPKPVRRRPNWVSPDALEARRARHKARQIVRALPAALDTEEAA